MPFHIANAMWTEYCEQVEEENKKQNENQNPGAGYNAAMQGLKMPDMPKFPSFPKF